MAAREIAVRLEPRAGSPATWELYDDNFPEGSRHRDSVDLLRDVLRAWSCQGEHRVVCNLAIRWDRANPKVGGALAHGARGTECGAAVQAETAALQAETAALKAETAALQAETAALRGETAALRGETAKREAELAKLTG